MYPRNTFKMHISFVSILCLIIKFAEVPLPIVFCTFPITIHFMNNRSACFTSKRTKSNKTELFSGCGRRIRIVAFTIRFSVTLVCIVASVHRQRAQLHSEPKGVQMRLRNATKFRLSNKNGTVDRRCPFIYITN